MQGDVFINFDVCMLTVSMLCIYLSIFGEKLHICNGKIYQNQNKAFILVINCPFVVQHHIIS